MESQIQVTKNYSIFAFALYRHFLFIKLTVFDMFVFFHIYLDNLFLNIQCID